MEDADVACPEGTTITVKKLFFNVPVRKKFLKSPAVEFSHVSDIVTRYALARHELDIKLFHDGRPVIDAPASKGDLLNSIVAIYGKEHATAMLKVDCIDPDFSLHGYIADPSITRSSRAYSSLFVNGRFVYSGDIAKAIESGYRGRVMTGRYPFYVLFLDIKPELIDVNIHPSKKEIKFSNEPVLLDRIQEWTGATLDEKVQKTRIPGLDTTLYMHVSSEDLSRDLHDGPVRDATAVVPPVPSEPVPAALLEIEGEVNKRLDHAASEATGAAIGAPRGDLGQAPSPPEKARAAAPSRASVLAGYVPLVERPEDEATHVQIDQGAFKVLPTLFMLDRGCQVANTFLVFKNNEGDLVIVDQHAASERVEYERLSKKVASGTGITSQELLTPKRINLPPALHALLDDAIPVLEGFGFAIEKKHEGSSDAYFLAAFPYFFHKSVDTLVIENLLEELLSKERDDAVANSKDEVLKIMACHAAIRAGDSLSPRQAWTLLRDLDRCDDPLHCCHGRPTWIVKTFKDLEKDFKRVL